MNYFDCRDTVLALAHTAFVEIPVVDFKRFCGTVRDELMFIAGEPHGRAQERVNPCRFFWYSCIVPVSGT